LLFYYQITITPTILIMPVFLVLAVLTALAVGTWLSALNVQYRDVRYVIPFLIQFWMFASPIVYPSSLVPGQWRPLFGLNPMVGVVEGFRWTLLGGEPPSLPMLAASTGVTVAVLITGLYYFRRMEQTFADTI
jgi:lipopolysaccharide transport system permease protein